MIACSFFPMFFNIESMLFDGFSKKRGYTNFLYILFLYIMFVFTDYQKYA